MAESHGGATGGSPAATMLLTAAYPTDTASTTGGVSRTRAVARVAVAAPRSSGASRSLLPFRADAERHTREARPAQWGSRSTRLTSLPAESRGKALWNDTSRGAL